MESTRLTADKTTRIDAMKTGFDALTPQKVNWRNVFDEIERNSSRPATENGSREIKDREIDCLKTMLKILSLEESCSRLSQEMDQCAVTSSAQDSDVTSGLNINCNHDESSDDDNIPGFISPSSQIKVSAIRNSWNWIGKLVKCINIHLHNSANYRQFFAEYSEGDRWMRKDLKKILKFQQTNGEYSDAQRLLSELESMATVLKLWRSRVDQMWSSARDVLPVHLRTTEVREATPAKALCHYSTNEIEFDENEDLLLLRTEKDNTRWRVSNGRGQTGDVPSVIILIPGTDPNVINEAVRMRLTLLEEWTDILKRIGRQIIAYMQHLFHSKYNETEIEMLRMLEERDKSELKKMLAHIEDALKSVWPDHHEFTSLAERLKLLQNIIAQPTPTKALSSQQSTADFSHTKTLIVQTNALCQVVDTYQDNIVSPLKDMWKQWAIFRISPEVNGHSQIRELVEKWERENTANRVFFASFWRSETPLYEMEKTLEELCKFKVAGIILQDPEAMALKGSYAPTRSMELSESSEKQPDVSPDSVSLENGLEDEVDFGIGMETKIAKTEQYSASESEERRKFVIRSVVDPSNQEEISLQESIDRGVIRPSDGTYYNATTGEIKPIPVAMKEGLIKVMFSTSKRTKEKKSSIGVITVKTIREQTRPYRVNSVIDTRTGKELNREEAVEQNIIDEGQGTYVNRQTGQKILIAEAAQLGLVNIEYIGDVPSPEINSNTYAVHAVFDRSRQKVITFLDAVRQGIVDKELGTYHDTLTGQRMYVSDAISQGYMKARLVEDVSKLNVDTDNVFTVNTTETSTAANP